MAEQGSKEWLAERAGKATASKIADIVAKTKSGPSASRANYLAQLVAERLTGQPAESYSNAAMQHGTETEPEARNAYCFLHDVEVQEVGFIIHPSIPDAGASPDGTIGDDGLIEIKCPNTATHIETLLGAPIERKHLIQMQWQLICTGRQWCDYASYDNRLPGSMALHVRRVQRDPALIAELEYEVKTFLADVAEKVNELKEKYNGGL
ncbi:MAG: lambda exonuclease family protein [Gallionella sp.]|jgi:putative phage-type endonuclease